MFQKKKKTSLAQYVRQRSIKTLLTQITINKYEKRGKDDKGQKHNTILLGGGKQYAVKNEYFYREEGNNMLQKTIFRKPRPYIFSWT